MSKSKGLGDTIEKVLKALKADKLVNLFNNKGGCGCASRKRKLNQW